MKKAFLILGVVVLAITVHANTIVFNTLGPGDTYSQSAGGYFVGTSSNIEQAAQFTSLASGTLATVDLGLTFNGVTPDPVNVYLYGDAAGSPDNGNQTLLGSGTPTAQFGATNNSIVSIVVVGSVPVTMGSVYWLVLKPTITTAADIWNYSSPSVSGTTDVSTNDATWTNTGDPRLPAFRLTASMANGVPDSGSTFAMLLGAVTALFAPRRRLEARSSKRT